MNKKRICYRFLDAIIAGDWAAASSHIKLLQTFDDAFSEFLAEQDLAPYLQWRLEPEGYSALPGWVRLSTVAFKAGNDQLREPLLKLLVEIIQRCGNDQFLLLKGPQLSQRLFGEHLWSLRANLALLTGDMARAAEQFQLCRQADPDNVEYRAKQTIAKARLTAGKGE